MVWGSREVLRGPCSGGGQGSGVGLRSDSVLGFNSAGPAGPGGFTIYAEQR